MDMFLKYFEESEIWPTHITDTENTFKRLMENDVVFLAGKYIRLSPNFSPSK